MDPANRKSQCLETSQFFTELPWAVREETLSLARSRTYACRQQMFVVDDPVDETLLIVEGFAKITQVTRNGKEVVLRLAARGDIVGELGLPPGSKHSSTAQTLEECEVLAWPTEVFEGVLVRYPILQYNVNNILRQRIGEIQGRISRISSTQVASKRLAHELVRLAEQMGQRVNKHVQIKVPQEVLAQMTAMGLFTLNRILSAWENQGLLRVHRQCIEIHDDLGLSGLRSLSGRPSPSG